MSRRRRQQRRKLFACGHRGFGEHCHRCALAAQLEQVAFGHGSIPHWLYERVQVEGKWHRVAPEQSAVMAEVARLRRAS